MERASDGYEDEGLARARHDLKNVLTALSAGCSLVERSLAKGDAAGARAFVEEMRVEIARAAAITDTLRER
ncbi:MAG: hypothetical protein R3F34_10960 [Planctomycetota bacterium]